MSIEQLLREGKLAEAQKQQDRENLQNYEARASVNQSYILEWKRKEDSYAKTEMLRMLEKDRVKIQRTQEHFEDHNKFIDAYEKVRFNNARKQFGNAIPPEISADIKNIANLARANGLRLEVNKLESKASDMIMQDNFVIEGLVNERKISEAAHQLGLSKTRINELEASGVLSKNLAEAHRNGLDSKYAEALTIGAIEQSGKALMLEGSDAGLTMFKEFDSVLKPLLKKVRPSLLRQYKAIEKGFNKGNKDSNFKYTTLEQSYSAGLKYKTPLTMLSKNRQDAISILKGKIASAEDQGDRAKYRQALKGHRAEVAVLGRFEDALKNPSANGAFIKGLNYRNFKNLMGFKDDFSSLVAYETYQKMRVGYGWGQDPVRATYNFIKDLRQEEVPDNPIDRAKDEAKVSQLYLGSGLVSKETIGVLSEVIGNPQVSDEHKQQFNQIITDNPNIVSQVNKNADMFSSGNLRQLIFANSDILANIGAGDPQKYANVVQWFRESKGGIKAINKLGNIIEHGGFYGEIQDIARYLGVSTNEVSTALAMEFLAGSRDKIGGLVIQGVINAGSRDIKDNKEFKVFAVNKLEDWGNKFISIGNSNFSAQSPIGSYLAGNDKHRKWFKGLFGEDGFFSQWIFNNNQSQKLNEAIVEATGLEGDFAKRLEGNTSFDGTSIEFSVRLGDGTRRKLTYEDSDDVISLDIQDIDSSVDSEEGFLDMVIEGISRRP